MSWVKPCIPSPCFWFGGCGCPSLPSLSHLSEKDQLFGEGWFKSRLKMRASPYKMFTLKSSPLPHKKEIGGSELDINSLGIICEIRAAIWVLGIRCCAENHLHLLGGFHQSPTRAGGSNPPAVLSETQSPRAWVTCLVAIATRAVMMLIWNS